MNRDALKDRLQQDKIDYLLVQFVDIHGSPKVKMVPTENLGDVADSGAGFAGGAVWGLGQTAAQKINHNHRRVNYIFRGCWQAEAGQLGGVVVTGMGGIVGKKDGALA